MKPKIYTSKEHQISHALVDSDALHIIHRLRQAGYEAYLVGGSVRDLLSNKKPKDFDISTSARPEEIKYLFGKHCLLIGRRFRLAHLRFGHKVMEVSTFRSGDNDSDLIVHDNLWGTAEEDVIRRDFTINGLYYDPETDHVIDYVGGWEDIQKRLLRTIGDATIRFKQDPVRMIRLLKFQARFDFHVEEKTGRALIRCREEIIKSAPARILEEMLRMLESGSSAPFFHLMAQSGVLELLFPSLNYFLESKHGEVGYKYLKAIDTIHLEHTKKPLPRSILTACLAYPLLEQEILSKYPFKEPTFAQVIALTSHVIHAIIDSSFSRFPKGLTTEAHFILSTQYRLDQSEHKKTQHLKIAHGKAFHLVLTFLKIRSMVNHKLTTTYDWWHQLHRQEETHPYPHEQSLINEEKHEQEDSTT